jgi:HPt (histidine-containing phosphotransfer) domain-containing protein
LTVQGSSTPAVAAVSTGDLPVIDAERIALLRELSDRGEHDLLATLVRRFVDEAPTRLAMLDAAMAQRDYRQAGALVHGLKGIASNLGASSLVGLLERLERQLDAGDPAASCLGFTAVVGAEARRAIEELGRLAASGAKPAP